MKKHLIAAAVAGAFAVPAMAQVTVSGKLRFAYESAEKRSALSTHTGGAPIAGAVAAKVQGLRVTDGDFRLTATEDLGGGMRATAYMEVLSRGRSTTIAGRDAGITLSGGFGSIFIGAIEAANGIEPLAAAGAPGYGDLDANSFGYNVLRGGSNVDFLSYTTPELTKGLTARFALVDGDGATAGNAGTGGMQATSTTSESILVGVNYNAGPLRLALDYTSSSDNANTTATRADNRTRLSGSYDLGVMRIGLGYETLKLANSATDKQTMIGVALPLGAATLGASYAEGKLTGAQKRSGYDLGANYALSKRTYAGVHYLRSEDKNATTAGKDSKFRIQLAHSF